MAYNTYIELTTMQYEISAEMISVKWQWRQMLIRIYIADTNIQNFPHITDIDEIFI